ncbi:MAG: phytoene desaturase family protein [Acidimicrobiales bacterium]
MTSHASHDVVVVGGGVGGLAAAIRLRTRGHRVTLFERHHELGGKLAVLARDGFVFDVGPSLVTLPHVYDELFRRAGTTLADEVDLVRLDPQFRYSWRSGRRLDVCDGGCEVPGYAEFVAHGRTIWQVSERTFFAGPMDGPWSLARRLRRPRDLTDIDPLRTLREAAVATFGDDAEMVQWAGRYATYSGSSPFEAPATLSCIAHVEHEYGCWYPMGGLGALRDAFVRVAERVGVSLEAGTEVRSITATPDRVTGVVLADGRAVPADVVVANADAEYLYRDLLPDVRAMRRVRRAAPSTSGFVVCAGVRGTTPDLTHHRIWFADDPRREFDEIAAGQLPTDPTLYACVSSVTDPSQAPAGHENWFVLINVPAGLRIDRAAATAHVLERLASHGTDLRERLSFTETLTPADLAERYRAPGGAIYGTSSNGRRAAFVRPRNRGIRDGLYLVGGSSHPGGGLPLVTTSARIVDEMIERDLGRRSRSSRPVR